MCHHTAITHLLRRLDHQGPTDRIDTMINAALECSGYYEVPRISDTWSSQMVEISIHSVTADGSSQEEAIRNWQVVAKNYNKAAAASATLCSPDAIPVQDMKAACETVMRQGVNHSDYDRARMLLEVLERTSLSGASQTDTPVGQRAPSKEGTLA